MAFLDVADFYAVARNKVRIGEANQRRRADVLLEMTFGNLQHTRIYLRVHRRRLTSVSCADGSSHLRSDRLFSQGVGRVVGGVSAHA